MTTIEEAMRWTPPAQTKEEAVENELISAEINLIMAEIDYDEEEETEAEVIEDIDYGQTENYFEYDQDSATAAVKSARVAQQNACTFCYLGLLVEFACFLVCFCVYHILVVHRRTFPIPCENA